MDKPTSAAMEATLSTLDATIVNVEDGHLEATRKERSTLHDAYVILDRLARQL